MRQIKIIEDDVTGFLIVEDEAVGFIAEDEVTGF